MFCEYNYKLNSFIFKTYQKLGALKFVSIQNGTLILKDGNKEYGKYFTIKKYGMLSVSLFESSLSSTLNEEINDIIDCNKGTQLIRFHYPNLKIRVTHVIDDIYYIDFGIKE